ncbi:hypothetical protein BCR37DRAFT_381211 [Protomyces lactucae-debilis]|uniref:RRM domain-containing protein n=1 Tax=Protomyces lactucae-debilis TaxID=2754530 RepID=A0A1Y2F9C6_PROLT|nr:uncharacterized protein BCR37DRAFT_381211 [Protomyces lactucae-debilis]ORY80520.1 hypothetical protein BCR37DRAFT_381211 [Protomyces lactucae-debilis]
MSQKLYIGGLAWATDDESLRRAFEEFGEITDCVVIKDRESGRSRGFGFVTYAEGPQADAAVAAMHNQDLDGRNIRVDKASDPADRPAFDRGGDRGGFRGGRGGGGRGGFRGGRGGYGKSSLSLYFLHVRRFLTQRYRRRPRRTRLTLLAWWR